MHTLSARPPQPLRPSPAGERMRSSFVCPTSSQRVRTCECRAMPCRAIPDRAARCGVGPCNPGPAGLRAEDKVALRATLIIGAEVLCAVAPFFKVAAAYNNGLTAAFETLQVATRRLQHATRRLQHVHHVATQ